MNRTKDELLLECIKQFEHIEDVLGYSRLSTTRSLINEINQALAIPTVVQKNEQLICDTCKSGLIDYLDIYRRTCRCGRLGYNVTNKTENPLLALDISDNDMPQQSETRVYVLDTQYISIGKGFDELTEEEWITECERQGRVYSLPGFAIAFNEEDISTSIDMIKIINVIK